jgi:uncharacterized membrane protein
MKYFVYKQCVMNSYAYYFFEKVFASFQHFLTAKPLS